jgi:hypothetical protein
VFGVRYSRVAKWAVLAVLLALTLGLKLAVRPVNLGDSADRDAQRRVVDFLARQRFVVSAADRVEEGRPMVRASAGACRLLIARSPAMGWDRDLIRGFRTTGDDVFAVYKGQVYAEQPTWRTVPNFLWARFRRELGMKVPAEPALAIVAAEICEAKRLPWAELAFASQY